MVHAFINLLMKQLPLRSHVFNRLVNQVNTVGFSDLSHQASSMLHSIPIP